MLRLAFRTLPVFAVIIGFAMALAAFLNFSGVRNAYLDLIRSRMAMIATAVAGDVSAANTLGIRLAEQTTLPDLLARHAATDPLMLSIDVAGGEDTVLFSSDPRRIGIRDDEAADVSALRQTQTISSDIGARVGAVTVRLDRAAIDATVERLRLEILAGAVPAGIGAVVAGCLMALLLLSRLYGRARDATAGREGDAIGLAEVEVSRLRGSSVS